MAVALLYWIALLFLFADITPKQYQKETTPDSVAVVNTENLLAAEAPPEVTQIQTTYMWNISYYGSKFHGRYTASGEEFDQNAMTCAHKTLPFGTELIVENPSNGKRVTVRVNDRGPFINGRQLDVSYGAAQKLNMLKAGVITAKVTANGTR